MSDERATAQNPMNILYGVLAVGMAFLYAVFVGEGSRPPVEYGFFSRCLVFILAVPLGYLGGILGDYVRQLAMPNFIITSGGILGILKERFFWFIVPQLVGIVVGGSCGSGIARWIVD